MEPPAAVTSCSTPGSSAERRCDRKPPSPGIGRHADRHRHNFDSRKPPLSEPVDPIARRPACLPCHVCIAVEDNGPGVSPEVAARLFKPFVQADLSTTRRYGGTGLGLSIVRGFAELMSGTVSIVSPNALGGAMFVVNVMLGEPTGSSFMANVMPLHAHQNTEALPDGYRKKPQTLAGVRLREYHGPRR